MSLFEQLGGTDGVRRFVDDLSQRLVDDPRFGPLFDGVDHATLRQHREHYFAAVLGGPENYSGRGLREAHRALRLDDADFDHFMAIAHESLVAVQASPAAIADLRDLLARLRPVIVPTSSVIE